MCTVTLSYDKTNAKARDMLATMLDSGLFYVNDMPEEKDRVYIEDGKLRVDIVEEMTDLEDFRKMLHNMVDIEYALP